MMNISSSTSTSCFDSALNYLDRLPKTLHFRYGHSIWELKMGISLWEIFDLYMRKCRRSSSQGDAMSDDLRPSSILSKVQDLVQRSINGLDSAVFRYTQYGGSDFSDIECKIKRFVENMRCFETNINELDIISLWPDYSLGDLQLIMDFIDSILVSMALFCNKKFILGRGLEAGMQNLQDKLLFLKSLISFAKLQGVEDQPLIKLLDHVEFVAVKAARLASTSWFQRRNEEECNKIRLEISQLHKMIDPVDSQVQGIYTHVLDACMSSRSSYTLAPKENRHLVAESIDYFLRTMTGIISQCYADFPIKVKEKMLELLERVRFLSILLSLQQEKFDKLNDETKDRIRVVVSDVGNVALSLSVNEMKEDLLLNLLEALEFIAEAEHGYPLTSTTSFSFPKTNELGSLDFFLETLRELVSSTVVSLAFPNGQIHTILEDLKNILKDLKFLRSFLGNIVEQRSRDEKLQDFWNRVMKVAYNAELEIDYALLGDKHELCLDAIAREIHRMKIEAEEIFDGETQGVTRASMNMPSQVTAPMYTETLVGLKDEVVSIIDRLKGSKQLDIVAIVGMPGLGKTSLAGEIYSCPSITKYFPIRAWCRFSQAYTKHSLLVQIFCCISPGMYAEYLQKNEDEMAEELRKLLQKQRYLIVFDDVWDTVGWDLLKHVLPNNCNGSRILLTSRSQKLSLQFKPDSEPHYLRPLTDAESCELLQKKLFGKEDCHSTFRKVFLDVANYCKGLPLAVVLVAGILATTERDCWEEVARHLTSSIYVDDDRCKKTVEQSFHYLPDYLRPCLLYFSAFKEHQYVPVRNMLWLWISEGFVQRTEGKNLEDVANDYLKDLIERSLVMDIQKRSLGGIKACRIHDLVHEFCVAKAKEESFLQSLRADDLLTLTGPSYPHRLSIHSTTTMELTIPRPLFPNLRCLFFGGSAIQLVDNSFEFLLSRLLRVLDLWNYSFRTSCFPSEVTFLVHLRYLRIGEFDGDVPSAIANLTRLETFAAIGDRSYLLPNTIWNIKTLRHLVTDRGFRFSINNLEGSPDLKHLDTLTLAVDPAFQNLQKILSKLSSIRKLTIMPDRYEGTASAESYQRSASTGNNNERLMSNYLSCGLESLKISGFAAESCKESASAETYEGSTSTGNDDGILMLDYLSRLEALKIIGFGGFEFGFPLNLKKLTLLGYRQPWSKISAIGTLPNLAVLKLCCDSFLGEKWEMEEGKFRNLQFLKLSQLDIRWWIASSHNLSCLKKLVLHYCKQLEEVPSCLGKSGTIDMIEMKRCCESAVDSVGKIQQEQREFGNYGLQIIIIKKR